MYGIVEIYDKNQGLIYKDNNLIVDRGREAQADLLQLLGATEWRIEIGTNNVAPDPAQDESLPGVVATKTVQSADITRHSATEVWFKAVFTSADYPGNDVIESRLLVMINTGFVKMFARRTLPAPISLGSGKVILWRLFT